MADAHINSVLDSSAEGHAGGPIKFEIIVIYNGISKTLEINGNPVVQAVLQHAIQLFGSLPNPHTLSLFTEGNGIELGDTAHINEFDLVSGSRLLLRPGAVKGGRQS